MSSAAGWEIFAKNYGNVQTLYVILVIGDSALPASLILCNVPNEEPVTYGPHSSF